VLGAFGLGVIAASGSSVAGDIDLTDDRNVVDCGYVEVKPNRLTTLFFDSDRLYQFPIAAFAMRACTGAAVQACDRIYLENIGPGSGRPYFLKAFFIPSSICCSCGSACVNQSAG
jgi:hypothetical protein